MHVLTARALSAIVLAMLAAPAHARSGDQADDLAAHLLDMVVVTAAAPQSPLTFELDPKLPRQPVPASDGADYLRTIPGFNALRSGGTNGDPVLRGQSGSRLNLQVGNGVLHGACPARMDNAMSYVSPETYDRVVVVKGPQTVLWGTVGSAGTVRFERDPPRFDSAGLRVDASVLAGSHGRNDQVLDVSAGAATGYARFSGNHARADDYRDGNGRDVPSRWMKWNADAEFGWTPNADTLLALALGSGDGEARYAGRGMDGTQFRRDSASLRWRQRRPGEHLADIDLRLFAHDVDHVMDNYGLRQPDPHGAMPMPMVAAVDRRSSGGRLATTWEAGNLQLIAGIDQQDSRHRGRGGMGIGAHHGQPWIADARFSQYGAFAEATWDAGASSRWVGGLRADRVRVRDLRAGSMHMPNPTAGLRRADTLPAGFLRFERAFADSPWSLHAGIGRAERFPDYWELFSAGSGPMGSINAFAGVQPERTTQLDLGLDYRGDGLHMWLSAYVGRIDDFVLFDYRDPHGHGPGHGHDLHGQPAADDHDGDGHGHGGHGHGPASVARNVAADIHGGEAGIDWSITPSLSLSASVAHAWGSNDSDGRPLPQIPPLEARLALNWQQGDWSFGGLLRGATAQERSAPGFGNVVGQDLGDSAGFAVFSLNAAWPVTPKLRLGAGIDNLFDRAYAEHLNLAGNAAFGYPAQPLRINEPGRTLWLKLDVRYD